MEKFLPNFFRFKKSVNKNIFFFIFLTFRKKISLIQSPTRH